MAAKTFAPVLFLIAGMMQTGCAGKTEPLSSPVAQEKEKSGVSVYRYMPLNASASHAVSGEYRKGMQGVNRTLEKDPRDPTSLKRRGALYAKAAQFENAEKDYDLAIESLQLQPKTEAKSALLSELHMQRALVKRERGDKAGAYADLTVAVDLAPKFWEPRFHRWQVGREMGKTTEANADREVGLKILPKVFSQAYASDHGIL